MLDYRLDTARRTVDLLGIPTGAGAEAIELLERILADPDYRPGFGFFRDRRGLPALSIEEAKRNAGLADVFPALKGSRWAIVVDDPTNFGTTRMQQMLGDWRGVEIRTFDDVDLARAWLATDPAATEASEAP